METGGQWWNAYAHLPTIWQMPGSAGFGARWIRFGYGQPEMTKPASLQAFILVGGP